MRGRAAHGRQIAFSARLFLPLPLSFRPHTNFATRSTLSSPSFAFSFSLSFVRTITSHGSDFARKILQCHQFRSVPKNRKERKGDGVGNRFERCLNSWPILPRDVGEVVGIEIKFEGLSSLFRSTKDTSSWISREKFIPRRKERKKKGWRVGKRFERYLVRNSWLILPRDVGEVVRRQNLRQNLKQAAAFLLRSTGIRIRRYVNRLSKP